MLGITGMHVRKTLERITLVCVCFQVRQGTYSSSVLIRRVLCGPNGHHFNVDPLAISSARLKNMFEEVKEPNSQNQHIVDPEIRASPTSISIGKYMLGLQHR